ncbi:hypothetical protein KVH27_12005 [Streptomyces olivaceus]|uniref:hypothetical protein n=1 Tax=Streptomyces olivaceus TaxID=47716 RepID=UPI001CCA2F83|nr:hypothetical protein [Streptomyces olivaceus]MBZ6249116.1 hypothetical protein [Streptomyces olivaceus]
MPGESAPPRADPSEETHRVPYREQTAPDYARDFGRDAQALPVDDGTTVLSGTCPRCGCSFTFTYRPRAFRGPRRGRQRGAPYPEFPVMCTCASEHAERPDGEEGCGAYWIVRLEDL